MILLYKYKFISNKTDYLYPPSAALFAAKGGYIGG